MKTYDVDVKAVAYKRIRVEAESEEKAEELAVERLRENIEEPIERHHYEAYFCREVLYIED